MATADGLLIVDKPAGWTSHDVVARCRRLCDTRRVGHAGTLDPMATGVLVLGINRATRLLTFLVGCDKTYTATIRLGQSTVTDDAEGEVTASHDVAGLTAAAVEQAIAGLTGEISQVPSAVSAIKVEGQRSYARVRAGQDVVLRPRPVTVSRFEVLHQRTGTVLGPVTAESGTAESVPAEPVNADPVTAEPVTAEPVTAEHGIWDLDVIVDVSSGTYVRALARDLGATLGVGGHLTALRRTRVGRFGLESAHSIDDLEVASEAGDIPVISLAAAARDSFESRELTGPEATAVGYGQRIPSSPPGRPQPIAAFAPEGNLVAMLDESGTLAKAHVVFSPSGS
ncbi:MAG: tRNA pseudouridine(55) synthase TruB [Dermatophilaceae bacterium]|nr:tRNA pseudouridine(55) synthase TruB [Dermatophilaceae bacterium]